MQQHEVVITQNGLEYRYTLFLHYKRMKNIVFRASGERANTFNVSLPYGMRISAIEKVFLKNLPSLVKLEDKVKTPPFTDKTYVFGQLLPLTEIQETYKLRSIPTTIEDFYHKMKKPLLAVLNAHVETYCLLMDIPLIYKVRIRKMKTRWASNSRQTLTLAFNERLIHYDEQIIAALVVHELVHHFVSGHGADFYKLCERYFPNYKRFDKMLKEHNYGAHYK